MYPGTERQIVGDDVGVRSHRRHRADLARHRKSRRTCRELGFRNGREAHFEHVAEDRRQSSRRQHCADGPRPVEAVLGHLDLHAVGGAEADHVHRVLRRRHHVVGHDRNADVAAYLGQPEHVVARHRLLDVFRPIALNRTREPDRIGRTVVIVGIDPQRHRLADRGAHRSDPVDVGFDGFADLDLDREKARGRLRRRLLRHRVRRHDADDRTDHRNALQQPAAEQIGDRNADRLGVQIVERIGDGGLGPDASLQRHRDGLHRASALAHGHADERRRDVTLDRADDLFQELLGLARWR